MSPRSLYPLSLLLAATGFLGARLLPKHTASRPSTPASPSAAIPSSPIPETSSTTQTTAAFPPTAPTSSTRSTGPAPLSFLEIQAQLAQQATSPAAARLAFMETIARMKPEELEALLLHEAPRRDGSMRMQWEFRFAAQHLAETSPQRAAQLWVSNETLRMQSDSLLAPWARKDPHAFAAWTLALPPESQKATAYALGNIAKQSPEDFFAVAPLLANSPAGPAAARYAADALVRDFAQPETAPANSPTAAPDWDTLKKQFAALPDSMRSLALAQFAKVPALQKDPEVLAAIASLPDEDARRLGRNLAKSADLLPIGEARKEAIAANVRQQAQSDVSAAAARLDTLVGSPDYPAAVRGFVEATAAKDPAAAADWALSIDPSKDPKNIPLRAAALDRVGREMFRRNPNEARTWVENAPLTNLEYLMLTGRQRTQ